MEYINSGNFLLEANILDQYMCLDVKKNEYFLCTKDSFSIDPIHYGKLIFKKDKIYKLTRDKFPASEFITHEIGDEVIYGIGYYLMSNNLILHNRAEFREKRIDKILND